MSNSKESSQKRPLRSKKEDKASKEKKENELISSKANSTGSRGQRSRVPKKSKSPRNPCGNESYAELIIKALTDTDQTRLSVDEIIEWFKKNITYCRENPDGSKSKTWQNSIHKALTSNECFKCTKGVFPDITVFWELPAKVKTPRRAAPTETVKNDKKKKKVNQEIGTQPNHPTNLHPSKQYYQRPYSQAVGHSSQSHIPPTNRNNTAHYFHNLYGHDTGNRPQPPLYNEQGSLPNVSAPFQTNQLLPSTAPRNTLPHGLLENYQQPQNLQPSSSNYSLPP